MRNAGLHVINMQPYGCRMTMIQIRNVPEDLHRRLKARAARDGVSLSQLALAELRRSLDRPTRRELLELVAAREPVRSGPSSTELIDAARNAS